MLNAIINADDFGINEQVTSEIERMISIGAITSTTIMANGACLDKVKSVIDSYPNVSYGIHLCLTEYTSLTKSKPLLDSGLINEEGIFVKKSLFDNIDFHNASLIKGIKDELHAQIDVIQPLNNHISHADSHHHVHTLFILKDVFKEVLLERGINKIRIGGDFNTLRKKMHLNQWIHRKLLNQYYEQYFRTTDSFMSYMDFVRLSHSRTEGVIELMCHPGHPGVVYRDEMAMVENLVLSDKVRFITYNDL